MEVDYGHFHLGPVSFALEAGCTALLGTNGAGKTTLMRSMLGLEHRATGRVEVNELRSDVRAHRMGLRSMLGWVPQSPEFPRFVTVRQCLAYAADLKGLSRRQLPEAIEWAASSTDLVALLKRQAGELSGGQRQRLAIAQAVIHKPHVLVMDEPTAGLDPVQRFEFREWLSRYAADHRILISTHMIEDVKDVTRQTIVLHDGRMVFSGSTKSLLEQVPSGGISLDEAAAIFLKGLAT